MRRADSRGRARRAPGAGCGHLHPPRGAGPRSPEVYATDRIPALGTGPRPWSGGRGRWSSGGWRPRAKKPDHIDIGVAPLTEEWTGAGGVRFDTTPPPVGEESNLTFDTISPVRRALSARHGPSPRPKPDPRIHMGLPDRYRRSCVARSARIPSRAVTRIRHGPSRNVMPADPEHEGEFRCRRSAVPTHGDAGRCPRALSETRTAPSCAVPPFTPTPKPRSEPGTRSRATPARPSGPVAATGDCPSRGRGGPSPWKRKRGTAVGQPARRPSVVERWVRGSRRPRCSRSVVPVYSVR